MENKFVKKPTPKGDKSTRIVFIGLSGIAFYNRRDGYLLCCE